MKLDILILSSLFIPALMYANTEECCEVCPQHFCQDKSGKFEVYGDYLYWEAREDQLSYAQDLRGGVEGIINAFNGNGLPGLVELDVSTKEAKFDWKSGFRVGAGYTLNCANWDFQLSWTRLHEQTKSNFIDPNAGIIPSNFPLSLLCNIISAINSEGTVAPVLANGAHSKWNFEFDNVDFQVGRSFFYCNSVALRLFLGIKGAWINQKLTSTYDGISLTTDTVVMPIDVSVKKTNDFHAVGPNFGINMAWEFLCNFSLVSDFSFAALYGRFHNNIQSVLVDSTVDTQIDILVRDNKHRIRPMVNGSIGIEWNNCSWECVQFVLGAAYEVQYWWNQWQIPVSSEAAIFSGATSPQGDLMLHGLTVHAGLAF